MNSDEFKQIIKEDTELINRKLKDSIDSLECPEILKESMEYSIMAPGKRIRPIIVIQTAKSLGKNIDKVLPLALAIEYIHSYSLIHDDLPAMDDDKLRRGRETSHIVFGEDMAILTGDSLLNTAVEIGIEGIPDKDPWDYISALGYLFKAAGINGMIGGQVRDIKEDHYAQKLSDIEKTEDLKTGALLKASLVCGSVPFIGFNEEVQTLLQYGNYIGKLFQITDDILDRTQSSEILGKDSGSDERNGKSTIVSILGLEQAKQRAQVYSRMAKDELSKLSGDFSFFYELTDFITNRDC